MLHRTPGAGLNFKFLGVSFDKALVMHDACRELAVEAGWRLKALLRCRKHHSKGEMFRLYKAQILSFIESRKPVSILLPLLRGVGVVGPAPVVVAAISSLRFSSMVLCCLLVLRR